MATKKKRTRLKDIADAASHAEGLFHREVLAIEETGRLRAGQPRFDLIITVDMNEQSGTTYKAVTFTSTTREGARRFALETLRRGVRP